MTSRSLESVWWLEGSEICPFCDHRYVWEMEVRCVDCDRPVCPVCLVRIRLNEFRCPDCGDSGEETR